MALSQHNSSPHRGLSIHGISKSYGSVEVLSGITMSVHPGEVVALLGENGAGKSTLSSIIAGINLASKGEMTWKGEPYSPSSPKEALDAGIGLIHQEIRLLPELSVAENMFIGRLPVRNGLVDREKMHLLANEQLARLGLNISPDTLVKDLKVAAQQQIEIAKALTLNAQFLILDEPTAALGGEETEYLFQQINSLKKEGVAFIYISHRLDEIAQIADRIIVLRDGKHVATHDTSDVPVNTLVSDMVGRSVDRVFPDCSVAKSHTVLSVENLSSPSGNFNNISFSVQQGEILGVAGIVGAGRTELVRAISGADPISGGAIYLDGSVVDFQSPADAIQHGIVLVPEDRKHQGLLLGDTIADNLAVGNFDRIAPDNWVKPSVVNQFARDAIQQMGIKGTPQQNLSDLSGGNQQKVIIAKWIARHPKVFILDEPTRGIDVGARAAIYEVIADLARNGMAVIVVSSDLDEVIGLSNRVLVLAHGEQQGILEGAEINQVSIMELATR